MVRTSDFQSGNRGSTPRGAALQETGGVPEWLKGVVSKTTVKEISPQVQILPPPLLSCSGIGKADFANAALRHGAGEFKICLPACQSSAGPRQARYIVCVKV